MMSQKEGQGFEEKCLAAFIGEERKSSRRIQHG
jgi:hypothetical protein